MDLIQLLRTFARRWYVVLPSLIVTVVAAFMVRDGVQPGYSVTANVVILPGASGRVANPAEADSRSPSTLLDFNAATQAKALTILANGGEFRKRVADGESLAAYSVTSPQRDPFVAIAVESKDRQLALQTAQRVIDELQAELDRQVPPDEPDSRVTLQTLAPPAVTDVDDSRLRAFVVALGLGAFASLALAVLVDGVAAWNGQRRRTKARRSDVAPSGQSLTPEHDRALTARERVGIDVTSER